MGLQNDIIRFISWMLNSDNAVFSIGILIMACLAFGYLVAVIGYTIIHR